MGYLFRTNACVIFYVMPTVRNCIECGEFTSNPKFCSRSCAATFNNRKYPKRSKGIEWLCPECGGEKYYQSVLCQTCRTRRHWDQALNRAIDDMFLIGNARIKYSQIRTWARKLMKRAGRLDKCEKCDFSLMIEVSHIKAIGDFSPETLMKEVNAQDNMMALCPNHHVEFEMLE